MPEIADIRKTWSELLIKLEWSGWDYQEGNFCPLCKRLQDEGHEASCELGKACQKIRSENVS